ncbi:MAG: hypothetical protein K0S41_4125 [Anaerocolumna sp.]|jgi:hypothetical protein|nr:hypothetical protein [Anaerocolumna sp.]
MNTRTLRSDETVVVQIIKIIYNMDIFSWKMNMEYTNESRGDKDGSNCFN